MATGNCLKRGSCGDVILAATDDGPRIVRDLRTARTGCRWLARALLRREVNALIRLEGRPGVPSLIGHDRDSLTRSFVPGDPMHEARPRSRAFYCDALRVLRCMHSASVAHNDLAKEANWIYRQGDQAGIVDFQLACCDPSRGRLFRLLAREDLRHLVKHKAHYRPDLLTERQRRLLAKPSWASRCWRALFKPAYRFLTRRLLGWPERYSAEERQRPA
jgi:RIO-like serine/threonine protein kinase